ncbi:ubiquitin-like-specific protease ESD4 [Prosopis cineraria]|uniref:ubiquitin-like-specific protease ESD4 n=1 Tax=Prosopis cineraria TaxID=364024 RepID=UPI00240FFBC5|nr:ubiquitin-like-specific protease ESD4 [Prosopis cineraria]XP_054807250.1 ubiquitin-like-specific protease ESD4 [Prosopis cineraria]
MGAITSNRKRSEECLSFNNAYSSPNSSDFRKPKRLKFLSMLQNPTQSIVSWKSVVSRIPLYPEAKTPSTRAVLGPCPRKIPLSSSNKALKCRTSELQESDNKMGNIFDKYAEAKNSALRSFRYVEKGKEVIEVDTDSRKGDVSEDSSIEEVEITEDGREGRSVVTDQRRQGSAGHVIEIQDSETKVGIGGLRQQSTSSVFSELNNSNLKVDDAGKFLGSLYLSPERGVPDVIAYKRLLEETNRRTNRLKLLDYEIQLNEKRRSPIESLSPEKRPEQELPHEPFVPLTQEEEKQVDGAFSANRKKVLVAHQNSNIEITGELLRCLKPGAWLNDEVINLYLELLKEREKREPKKYLKCHFFNTFFYKKLIGGKSGYDFKSVRRWTTQRKLGYSLIECDKIFVPIHKEIHWCLAVINKKDKKFQYLDSLRGMDSQVLKVLARYFVDEVKDKNGTDVDVSSWEREFVEDLPEQENGFDCGMFMIKYADFYSRGLGLCFNQEHMPYFRRRTAKEILRLKAD